MEFIGSGKYKLSTGKEIVTWSSVIGLGNSENVEAIPYGYDGSLLIDYEREEPESALELTPEEAIEVAEYMAEQWKELANNIKEKDS